MKRPGMLAVVALPLALAGYVSSRPQGAAPATYQRPPARPNWDLQLGAKANRFRVPAGVNMLEVDGFETSAASVAKLRAQGVYPVAYINAGSWEAWRPDAAEYPNDIKLQPDPDWPDEVFLDVRDVFRPGSVLAGILRRRLQMCRAKGFLAVDPDNLQNDENVKSGVITLKDQVDFNGWFADEAHRAGLAVFQKNGPDKILLRDRTGKRLVDKFDGIVNESCQVYRECAPLAEYVKLGKPAMNVEYRRNVPLDCSVQRKFGARMLKRDLALRAPGDKGYFRETCP